MSNEASSNPATAPGEGLGPPAAASVDAHIGSRIRARRRMLRLTQEELASRVGVTAQQVHKYESGANRVAASKLFEIATVLTMPISGFFEGLPAPSSEPDAEARAKNRLLIDKGMLELAMSFDDIEEARLRRVVLRIIKAAADAQREQD